MPTDPHTWTDQVDYWTATYANGDLYRYNGQEFAPTGIQFHARRPLYRSFMPSQSISINAGTWGRMFQPVSGSDTSDVNGDTGGLFGAYVDPATTGQVRSFLAGGGGLGTTVGGLGLLIGHAQWPAQTSGQTIAGFGSPTVSPVAGHHGQFQEVNTAFHNLTYVVDIVDAAAQKWALWSFNASTATQTPAPDGADGSGRAARMFYAWASVYPANGHTVASLPAPVTSWTSSSTLSAALLNGNTGIRDILRFLNMPPLLSVMGSTSSGQSFTANTANVTTMATVTYDTYSGWNGTNTYTVPFNGLYLVYVVSNVGSFTGTVKCGAQINAGTTYYGPNNATASGSNGASKIQIFSLNSGDTIKAVTNPNTTITGNTGWPPRMIVMYLGMQGAPATLPALPDSTFRWNAGNPGDQSPLFNAHLANDLAFLTQRPYLLAYQASAQSGFAMGTTSTLTLDTNQGIVHADNGDNYSGWTSGGSNLYTIKRAGWYLAVGEVFWAAPTLTASPVNAFAVKPNPAGTNTWDFFQQNQMITGAAGSGAGGAQLYYFRVGDTITPGALTNNSSATTLSTGVSTGVNSHMELIWMGE